mmetsp:Transcript_32822/g.55352  ORF Transcript_32822/g.55352 Transcript_32822/m.55352 type:complete len:211 (+) Transcript_32822:378-1010(+)
MEVSAPVDDDDDPVRRSFESTVGVSTTLAGSDGNCDTAMLLLLEVVGAAFRALVAGGAFLLDVGVFESFVVDFFPFVTDFTTGFTSSSSSSSDSSGFVDRRVDRELFAGVSIFGCFLAGDDDFDRGRFSKGDLLALDFSEVVGFSLNCASAHAFARARCSARVSFGVPSPPTLALPFFVSAGEACFDSFLFWLIAKMDNGSFSSKLVPGV